MQSSTLTLVLVPFEYLIQITSDNLCQTVYPGKNVSVRLVFANGVFPADGSVVNYTYIYNQE